MLYERIRQSLPASGKRTLILPRNQKLSFLARDSLISKYICFGPFLPQFGQLQLPVPVFYCIFTGTLILKLINSTGMKSILLLLLVFANMGFTIADNSVQESHTAMPSLSHSSSMQDRIIVASPDNNMIVMN